MISKGFGLRGRSLLALGLTCLLALIPTGLLGWQILENIREHFGVAFARNLTLLNREKILAPLSRELALSQRLADSELTRQWLLDEKNAEKRATFFKEAEGYRRDFRDHAYFVASRNSLSFYYNDTVKPYGEAPRYHLDADVAANRWFYDTLRQQDVYNINIDSDPKLGVTKVWMNVLISNGKERIGVTGAGLDLSHFLHDFMRSSEAGVTPIIINDQGAIQAHSDTALIAFNSGASGARDDEKIFRLIQDQPGRDALSRAMQAAQRDPQHEQSAWVKMGGKRQLLVTAYIPELKWHVMTILDLRAATLIGLNWLLPIVGLLLILFSGLVLGFTYAVERLVLKPLRHLQRSAGAIAAGRYDLTLPKGNKDEIGELSAAFSLMADKVRTHTVELETRVNERTHALQEANSQMQVAHKKIADSIDYASLIQRAILSNNELAGASDAHHAMLWRPRDVVGGDFYLHRSDNNGWLFGVVDCAGHGVPGALMTMLAHAALDQAISQCGIADPAAILSRTDQIIRTMSSSASDKQSLATNMDMGLAYVDLVQEAVTFAGARIALHYSDGVTVEEVAGARRAVGDKRMGSYANTQIAMTPGRTFYMTSDGFLDQAYGKLGYSFGNARFAELLQSQARQPLHEQIQAFSTVLAECQTLHAQRDDITVLCFRFT